MSVPRDDTPLSMMVAACYQRHSTYNQIDGLAKPGLCLATEGKRPCIVLVALINQREVYIFTEPTAPNCWYRHLVGFPRAGIPHLGCKTEFEVRKSLSVFWSDGQSLGGQKSPDSEIVADDVAVYLQNSVVAGPRLGWLVLY